MRMRGHAEHDDMWYVPAEILAAWRERDPLDRLEAFLVQEGYLRREDLQTVTGRIGEDLDRAAAEALRSPFPPPEEALRGVYRETGYENPWWPAE